MMCIVKVFLTGIAVKVQPQVIYFNVMVLHGNEYLEYL